MGEHAAVKLMSEPDGAVLGDLKNAVSGVRMMETLDHLARFTKLAGTPSERESLEGLRSQLANIGFETSVLEHDAYISLPGKASLQIASAAYACITHSMGISSPADGLTADLVDLPSGRADDLPDSGVAGKVVVIDGIASPDVTRRMTALGVAGIIHVSPHEHIHEMCISPVWGSPSMQTMKDLPACVVISVSATTGLSIREQMSKGAQRALIHAEVDTGWRKTPLLVAEMAADEPAEEAPFVLFSGHHDTWYYGVMDNGSANACMIEVARLAVSQRAHWRRSLRICIWSGHSQGRYSGSAWYVDQNWADFDRRCVAHVNIDSPGGIGAGNLKNTGVMRSLRPLAARAIAQETGQVLAGKPKVRSADESLQGIGIPSMFGSLSGQFPDPESKMRNALGWWWHTPDDLIDKIDEANLVRDARIVLECVWRLLSEEVLPIDIFAPLEGLRSALLPLQEKLDANFDLGMLFARIDAASDRLRALQENSAPPSINSAIMRASRELVLLEHSRGDRFVHEPALALPAWPVLEPLRILSEAAPGTDSFHFAMVDAVRARNRIAWHLERAAACMA